MKKENRPTTKNLAITAFTTSAPSKFKIAKALTGTFFFVRYPNFRLSRAKIHGTFCEAAASFNS